MTYLGGILLADLDLQAIVDFTILADLIRNFPKTRRSRPEPISQIIYGQNGFHELPFLVLLAVDHPLLQPRGSGEEHGQDRKIPRLPWRQCRSRSPRGP